MSDDVVKTLSEGRTARVKVWSERQAKEVPIYLSPVLSEDGEPMLLIASEAAASIMIRPSTPPNAFELVRGNFPLDVARSLVVLLAGLARSDGNTALDAKQIGEQNERP